MLLYSSQTFCIAADTAANVSFLSAAQLIRPGRICNQLAAHGSIGNAAVGKLLPAPETIGLDAVFPAILLALVIPAFKNRTTLIRAASGAALALAAVPFVPTGLPVLLSLFGLLSRKK